MLNRVLWIMMAMWLMSFGLLGAQFLIGDVMQIEMVVSCSDNTEFCQNIKGQPLKPFILGGLNVDQVNEIVGNTITGNYEPDDGEPFDKIKDFGIAAAFIGWELVTLITGTYIFSFMYLIGVPFIVVTALVFAYGIMVVRSIVTVIRGV